MVAVHGNGTGGGMRGRRAAAMLSLAVALAAAGCTEGRSRPRASSSPSPPPKPLPVTGRAWVEGKYLHATGRVLTASGAPAVGATVRLRPDAEGTPFDALFAIAPGGSCVATDCSGKAEARTGAGGTFTAAYLGPDSGGAWIAVQARDGSSVALLAHEAGGLPDLRLWAPRWTPRWDGPMLTAPGLGPWPEGTPGDRGFVVHDARGNVLARLGAGLVETVPLDLRLAGTGAVTVAPFVTVTARTVQGRTVELTYDAPPVRVPPGAVGTDLSARATCTVLGPTGRRTWTGPCHGRTAHREGETFLVDLGRSQRVELVVASDCGFPPCAVETSEDGRTWTPATSLRDQYDDCRCIVGLAAAPVGRVARYLRLTARHSADQPLDANEWYSVTAWGPPVPRGRLAPRR